MNRWIKVVSVILIHTFLVDHAAHAAFELKPVEIPFLRQSTIELNIPKSIAQVGDHYQAVPEGSDPYGTGGALVVTYCGDCICVFWGVFGAGLAEFDVGLYSGQKKRKIFRVAQQNAGNTHHFGFHFRGAYASQVR